METPTNSNKKNTAVYGALVILQCLIWGVGNSITKFGLDTVAPFTMLALRFTIAFLLFMLVFGKKIIKDFKREYILSSLVICLSTAASFIFATFSLLLTTATISGFLMAQAVIFTPIMSIFILKQKPDKKLIPIILVIVVGMYFLCAGNGKFTFGLGELMAILAAVTGAAMLIYTSKHVTNIGPITLATMQTLVCAVCCIICMLLFEDVGDLAHASASGWFSIIYLAAGCTCIAYLLQNIALRKVSATFVSLAFCSEPVFTAASAFFILQEVLSLRGFIGCVLIIVGLVLATLLTGKEEPPSDKEKGQDTNENTLL